MAKDKSSFAGAEYPEYPAIGPTPASPGPTLLKHAAVAVKFVSISKGSRQRRMNIAKKQTMYSAKYKLTLR